MWVSPKAKLSWETRRKNHAYRSSEKTWIEQEAKTTRCKNMVKEYAKQLLRVKSGQQDKIDLVKVGLAYRKDQARPDAQAEQLLKQEVIKDMIADEIREILEKEGVTDQYVINKVKKAIDLAETVADAGNMIRGAQLFAKMRDMEPKQQGLLPPVPDEEYLKTLIDSQKDEPVLIPQGAE